MKNLKLLTSFMGCSVHVFIPIVIIVLTQSKIRLTCPDVPPPGDRQQYETFKWLSQNGAAYKQ